MWFDVNTKILKTRVIKILKYVEDLSRGHDHAMEIVIFRILFSKIDSI